MQSASSVVGRWAVLLTTWLSLATVAMLTIFVSRSSIGVETPLWLLVRLELPIWLYWALITIPIVMLARRFPLDRERMLRSIALHLTAAVAAALGFVTFKMVWYQAFNPYPILSSPSALRWFWQHVRESFVHGFALYWAVLGVYHAFTNYFRYRERDLEASRMRGQLAEARLHALQMQLRPHFLFNSLNSAAALVENEPVKARYVLGRLSELLRRALRWNGTSETSLATEIDHLNAYLDIERIRFGDRLHIQIDISPDARDCAVPGFILQPLVENAVRHGVAAREGAGQVVVTARRDGSDLEMHVMDDGPGIDSDVHQGGIGLSNVKNRLAELYGSRHKLVLNNRPEGGLDVLLRFPYRIPTEAVS